MYNQEMGGTCMKVVTTTAVFPAEGDERQQLKRLARIGFDALDFGFDASVRNESSGFSTPQFETWAYDLKECAEENGISFSHTHAPFDVCKRGEIVERTMRCAHILGAKYIVVHPACFKGDGSFYEDEDEFLDVNVNAVMPILEAAAKHDMTVLSENLLWGPSIQPAVLSELVTHVGAAHFGWCFDTGHANCFGVTSRALVGLANVPLSLHVQDNHGVFKDEHLLPGDGTIDWKDFIQTLNDIGYAGDFVLEAHHQSMDAPDDERDAILADLLARSKKLVAFYERIHKA